MGVVEREMRRPSVLVVDDDALSRTIVAKKLARFADVVEADNGLDALALLKTASVDLAIIDLEMPNFNGVDLIKCMRGHPRVKHIPIIVLTANETRSGLETALIAGATSFLLKPLNWGAFGEHIRHVLELAYRAGHLALHDQLTDLPNRVLLKDRLEHALANAGPHSMVATHVIDLDLFKHVNDSLGHPVGDQILRMVADRLKSIVRDSDTVARMGGDEFAIVQLELPEELSAASLARRIIDVLTKPYEIEGREIIIGASVGIALASEKGRAPEQLIRDADVALYRAKSDGRAAFRFFRPEMDLAVQRRGQLEQDLRKALVAEEFQLYYQPILDLAIGKISGFEALVRWNRSEKGLVLPGEFIPVAEETGLIIPLGEWVVGEACRVAAQWPGDLKVAVNISPAHFRKPGLTTVVVEALAASGLAPERLELEITETTLLQDNVATLAALRQLHTMGVRIVLDDFGTGYSSLSYLQTFPFDKIKIDRSFVKNVCESESSLNIVRAVANLAIGQGMSSTAEGVETAAQLNAVSLEGYTEVQGYLLSKPVPAGEIAGLLQSGDLRIKGKLHAVAA